MSSSTSTSKNQNQFNSEGFDLDAIPSSENNSSNEVILEVGGGASFIKNDNNITSTKTTPTTTTSASTLDKDSPIYKSEELKAQANERFKVKDYIGAYDLYTDAIYACPGMPGSKLLELKEEFEEEERSRTYERHRRETDRRRKTNSSATKEKDKDDSSDDGDDGDNDEVEGEGIDDKEPRVFTPPTHPHSKELSIYYSNRAACNFALERNEDAVSDCDIALIINPTYTKALLRRMAAYEALSKTEEALQDAKEALKTAPRDTKIIGHNRRLQKLEDERMEKLKAETMDKLKGLGNSMLGYFGLSLDNFKADQDPNTGSYNIAFNQNTSK